MLKKLAIVLLLHTPLYPVSKKRIRQTKSFLGLNKKLGNLRAGKRGIKRPPFDKVDKIVNDFIYLKKLIFERDIYYELINSENKKILFSLIDEGGNTLSDYATEYDREQATEILKQYD